MGYGLALIIDPEIRARHIEGFNRIMLLKEDKIRYKILESMAVNSKLEKIPVQIQTWTIPGKFAIAKIKKKK